MLTARRVPTAFLSSNLPSKVYAFNYFYEPLGLILVAADISSLSTASSSGCKLF
jgi:hypothetical protein